MTYTHTSIDEVIDQVEVVYQDNLITKSGYFTIKDQLTSLEHKLNAFMRSLATQYVISEE